MEIAHNVSCRIGIAAKAASQAVRTRIRDDRGEGVISMAIAILVVASVGVVLWGIFQMTATDLGNDVDGQIGQIGGGGGGTP